MKEKTKRQIMSKIKTGTLEWAEKNVNIITGCEHRCRYCYAADMTKRFRRIATLDDWGNPVLRAHEVDKQRRKSEGRIMFPSTHDITPQFLDECVTVLRNLLAANNEVLIVTKPHLECVQRLCRELAEYKKNILFRFTIGAMDNDLLAYWEPGAPDFPERLAALKYAHAQGFATSVSAEPMLDAPRAVELYERLVPFVTDTLWFGKMNMLRKRMSIETAEDEAAVQRIKETQADDRIIELYEQLKNEAKVQWKDSIKKLVGLTLDQP